MFFFFGKPAGWARANGLANEDDVFGIAAERVGEMVISFLDGLVASFFIRLPSAVPVAGVVVGNDPESASVHGFEHGSDRLKVFGVSVGPEDRGASRRCGEVADGDGSFSLAQSGEVFAAGIRIGIPWRLEEDRVGEDASHQCEKGVAAKEGVAG